MSFIGQVCLHIRGICYSDRSSTVQQNDSNRTGLKEGVCWMRGVQGDFASPFAHSG